jgi:hypothetical protein
MSGYHTCVAGIPGDTGATDLISKERSHFFKCGKRAALPLMETVRKKEK